ncbi:hypothetical protein HW561_23020 [Rhodobacteraceae bacterium B1Z28]|uniref:Uncharacterized protein n=1 Tax=Ruegeria haliotis TaxID=2747601 RepID=A0ABX2PZY9_9RHOB|nr:hypothetical protein [Ruegeria haliotis]
MDSPGLISFPLPLATALLCGVLTILAWRLDLGFRQANMLFSGLCRELWRSCCTLA